MKILDNQSIIIPTQCPQCQKHTALWKTNSQEINCLNCKYQYSPSADWQKNQLAKFYEQYKLDDIKLAIGLQGTWWGEKYTIVGRTKYATRFYQYYQTQNDSGTYIDYNYMVGTYDLWVLKNSEGKYEYLYQMQNNIFLIRVIEDIPIHKQNFIRNLFVNERSLRKVRNFYTGLDHSSDRYGSAQILFQIGENDPSQTEVTEFNFFTYKIEQKMFIAELALTKIGEKEGKLSLWRGEPMSKIELLKFFIDHPPLQKKLSFIRSLFLFRNLSYVILSLLLLFFFTTFSDKKVVFEKRFDNISLQDSLPKSTPEFELNPGSYSFELYCILFPEITDENLNLTLDLEAYAWAEIYDDEEDLFINEFGGDFWYAKGYEDMEKWIDEQSKSTHFLKVNEKGLYSADIFMEKVHGDFNATFILKVKEAGFQWFDFILPLVFFLFVGALIHLYLWLNKWR
jgi:Zn ribbon nucleic-acid-binding protein